MNIVIFHIFKRKEKKILKSLLDEIQFVDDMISMTMVYTSKIAEKTKLPKEEIDSVLSKLREQNIVRNSSIAGGDKSWTLTHHGLDLMCPNRYQLFKEGLKLSGLIIGIIAGLTVLAVIMQSGQSP